MQYLEPIDDVNNLTNATIIPMQASEEILPPIKQSWMLVQDHMNDRAKMSRVYHMAIQDTINGQTEVDLFHDSYLELQERMRNSIVFHPEMMGDIMYFHQAIRQPDG